MGMEEILQVCLLIRQFIWYRLRAGNTVSAWFDQWCSLSPLSQLVTPRGIHRAGFDISSKVQDVISNESWKWLNEWLLKYPSLYTIIVPTLVSNSLDRLFRVVVVGAAYQDVDSWFSVAIVWECIRPRGDEIDWYNLVWFSHDIPRHAIHLWLVIKRKLKTQDTPRQWDLKPYTGVPNMPSSLDVIVDLLNPVSQRRSARLSSLLHVISYGKNGIIGYSRIRRDLKTKLLK
ncbi:reverse transcriptase domain, reverse transcriptase zinc-binding domain protein [Tanacetum coccineum]|uniref:Reverse transcriptase domain, reverse transcriptase zinc-binding domain protein n=1 Tax=Tanacetum coccineum TaxID=301880 RepID=A0ABQ4ZEI5_9ASTR